VGQWQVLRVGAERISHCVRGLRSDAAAPQPGKPQLMFTADDQLVILRVRAAEWSFAAAREIDVTLVTANGQERRPAAEVHGSDLIDIAFGTERQHMTELAGSSHLEIRVERTVVRLPLSGLAGALPAYRDCLARIGKPLRTQVHASAAPPLGW
jgi:hypothetical protein